MKKRLQNPRKLAALLLLLAAVGLQFAGGGGGCGGSSETPLPVPPGVPGADSGGQHLVPPIEGGQDITPPAVVLTTPADGASDAALDVAISVTFSEEMDPATVNEETILVTEAENPVEGFVSYDVSTRTAMIALSHAFARGVSCIVRIRGTVSDLAGNLMGSDYAWEFTTDPAYYVGSDGDDAASGTADRPWATIQHAVDAVASGDTIRVLAGHYQGAATLHVSKSLNLLGAGSFETFIDPPQVLGAGYEDQAVIDVAGSDDGIPENIQVRISGFTVDAQQTAGLKFCVLLRGGAYAEISDSVFRGTRPSARDVNSGNIAVGWSDFGYAAQAFIHDNVVTDFLSFGIAAYGPGNDARIERNVIQGNSAMHVCSGSPGSYAGAMGIVVQASATATIADNEIFGMRRNPLCAAAAFDSAIELYWAGALTVSGNTIHDNDYGFGSYAAYGPNGELTMEGNRFEGNTVGVQLGNIAVNSLQGNDFSGNSLFALRSLLAAEVDVTENFWGSGDGPNPPGSGDPVSGNLLVDPWRTTPLD